MLILLWKDSLFIIKHAKHELTYANLKIKQSSPLQENIL